jgi:GAF domain-containing protein
VLLEALREIAVRAAIADRIEPPSTEVLLHSIAEATVALFDAEAASIALYDAPTDRLVFRVAAGAAGQPAVGLSIRRDEGIAGYVFTSGQALGVSDVAQDPRWGRSAAEATGYTPRSLIAVPLVDDSGSLGVLEILDRKGDAGFGLRDIELASMFARQATTALRATRVERDVGALVAGTLVRLAASPPGTVVSATDALTADLRAAIGELDGDDEGRLWALADAVAAARTAAPAEIDLIVAVVDLLARRSGRENHARGGLG